MVDWNPKNIKTFFWYLLNICTCKVFFMNVVPEGIGSICNDNALHTLIHIFFCRKAPQIHSSHISRPQRITPFSQMMLFCPSTMFGPFRCTNVLSFQIAGAQPFVPVIKSKSKCNCINRKWHLRLFIIFTTDNAEVRIVKVLKTLLSIYVLTLNTSMASVCMSFFYKPFRMLLRIPRLILKKNSNWLNWKASIERR